MSFFESRIVSSASKSRGLIGNPAYSPDLSELVELGQSPLSNSKRTVKRILDVVGAGLALLLLSPLMLLTALAIRMESGGPILFRQQRVGYNAKRFVIFKFRTMVVMEDDDSIAQVRRFDPRVTKLGRVLRANSVDELPQLMNVLSGEMSLVGPRPHAVAHDIYYSYYSKTLSDYSSDIALSLG